LKCKKCGFISYDYLELCPSCSKSLSAVRQDLGLFYHEPEVKDFDEFFTGSSSTYKTSKAASSEAELDLDNAEDFEFTLDD
jgi:hypothetical protein